MKRVLTTALLLPVGALFVLALTAGKSPHGPKQPAGPGVTSPGSSAKTPHGSQVTSGVSANKSAVTSAPPASVSSVPAVGGATVPPGPTLTVEWVTTLAPGVKAARGPEDVTYPQRLRTSSSPTCGVVIQADTYRYDGAHKSRVDALVAGGLLSKYGDAGLLVSWDSWRMVTLPACTTPTSPSPSHAGSVATPPGKSTPTPSTPVDELADSSSPSQAAPTGGVGTGVTVTNAPNATPPLELAQTGVSSLGLLGLGVALLVGGGALLWTLRRGRHS